MFLPKQSRPIPNGRGVIGRI